MACKFISAGLRLTASDQSILLQRCLSTSSAYQSRDGWLNKLLVRKIEPTKESHSSMLSGKEVIYEMQTHNVKPGSMDKYLKNYEVYVDAIKEKNLSVDLCGSWTVGVGDQDQCLHLWKYAGGYAAIDNARVELQSDSSIVKLTNERNEYLRERVNQFLLAFSFWPPVAVRDGSNVYEIRSYILKPGTMIEWGNNWVRGIQFRQANNEAYGGFFSQVGRLYNVHHIWCYQSLAGRKKSRESSWQNPGWNEVVAYTVPLIRETHTRLLFPNDFSPTR